MKGRSSRKDSSDTDSTSSSQISPKSSEHPRKKRPEVTPLPGSPAQEPTKKRAATEIGVEGDAASSNSSELSNESTLNVCICQPDPKIPRPRNAFILYRQHHQPSIIAQHPGLTAPEISKVIGEQWRRQPNEIKNEWKKRAEEVKVRHQIQYPDYRYQPRRSNRRGSTIESPSLLTPTISCDKCGGRSTTSPTTPTSAHNPRAMPLPATSSTYTDGHGRYLHAMNNLSIMSPHPSRNPGHPGVAPVIPYPGFRQTTDEDRSTLASPDTKRRRFNNGGHHPNNGKPMSSPYTAGSPYREVFVRADSIPSRQQLTPGFMGPPPRPTAMQVQAQRARSLTLAPLRTADQSKRVEAMVMSMPYIGKIVTLGRIAPPLQMDALTSLAPRGRGILIAVEGDEQTAVREAVKWLGETLGHMKEYCVRTAEGPKLPELDRELQISDYLSLMIDWHPKSKEIISFITKPPTVPEKSAENDEAPEKKPAAKVEKGIPIVLLERYQLYAANMFACKIPIKDSYSPVDHWQWMATMWRDTVGPDLTVYIKDAESGNEADVEVNKELRCITVTRRKTAAAERARLGDAESRRLAFEIGEWARAVGQQKESAAKPPRATKDDA